MNRSFVTLLLILSTLLSCTLQESKPQENKLSPNQTKVLIIGDSISLAYTPHVIKLLEGKMTVKHHKGNAGPSIRGLERICL